MELAPRIALLLAALACAPAAASRAGAAEPAWSPARNVEIISSTGVGGAQDRLARVLQLLMQNGNTIAMPVVVVNKPGGNGSIAAMYLNRTPGDAHALLVSSALLLSSYILGRTNVNYTDMTPVAQLFHEYAVVLVKPDSPVRDARDFIARLKAHADSVSIGVTALGTAHHLSVALAAKAAGVDPRGLKMVTFKSGTDALVAMLGGHVDASVSSVSNSLAGMASGTVRPIAVSAPSRLPGTMATVPTWRELGLDAVTSNFRTIFGPRGMSEAQVAYWQAILRKVTASSAWAEELEKNAWVAEYLDSAQTKAELAQQYATLQAVLSDLGMAKQ